MAKSPGVCIFCGRGGLSKEHVLPNWLGKMVPRSSSDSHTERIWRVPSDPDRELGPPERRQKQGRAGTTKVRKVCREFCNQGWMGRLEERVKPLLLHLLVGRTAFLTEHQQAELSLWAVKTAMVAEFANPAEILTPQEHRTFLMDRQAPPPGWFVWIGKHDVASWVEALHYENGTLGDPAGQPRPHGVMSLAIGLGHLFVYVIGTTDEHQRFELASPRAALVPVWPIRKKRAIYPGPTLITSDEAALRIATRIVHMPFLVRGVSGPDASISP